MTDRAHLYRVITDSQGNVRSGQSLTISVYQPGTTTPIADPLYADNTTGTTVANPFVTTTGVVDFYLATPQRVDLKVDDGASFVLYRAVDVLESTVAVGRSLSWVQLIGTPDGTGSSGGTTAEVTSIKHDTPNFMAELALPSNIGNTSAGLTTTTGNDIYGTYWPIVANGIVHMEAAVWVNASSFSAGSFELLCVRFDGSFDHPGIPFRVGNTAPRTTADFDDAAAVGSHPEGLVLASAVATFMVTAGDRLRLRYSVYDLASDLPVEQVQVTITQDFIT